MGIVLWAMSISGYAQSISYFKIQEASSIPTDLNYNTEVTIPTSPSFKLSISPDVDTSTHFYNFSSALHVVTSEGDFVLSVGNGSFDTTPPSPGSTKTVNKSLGLTTKGSYILPGYFISSYLVYDHSQNSDVLHYRISGNVNSSTGSLNGTVDPNTYYSTQTVFTVSALNNPTQYVFTNVQSSSGSDYMQILTNIYNELLAQGLTLDDLYNELLDQGISLDSLVDSVSFLQSSICYDMPSPVDTNYYLTTCSFSSLNSNLYNFNLNPCLAQFRFKEPFSNVETVSFKRPSSGKIMLLYSRLGSSTVFDRLELFNNDVFVPRTSFAVDDTFGFVYYDLSYFPADSFFDLSFRVVYGNDISLGIYEYRISANDILEYMKEQWGSTQPSTDSLDSTISATGDMQSDINFIDDNAFTDFSGAYDHTGISAFSWTVFSGMSVFSSIVNKFYFALPSEFSLYITAVLIVGVIAVLLSAVGRIIKKGGD